MPSRKLFSLLLIGGFLVASSQARAGFDYIIDDTDAQFHSWSGGILQTAFDASAYGGSYHYVTNWGAYDGVGQQPNNASALVEYRLPDGVNLPPGERLYNIYAWSPTNWNQWHAVNVAANGTKDFDQQISWPGQFGTNKQWLGFDPNEGPDPIMGGSWVKLGVGPQSDPNADGGEAVYMNPSINQKPYLWIEYQPWFTGTIAFDAIRIVEVPEPGSIALAAGGCLAFCMMTRRLRRRSSPGVVNG